MVRRVIGMSGPRCFVVVSSRSLLDRPAGTASKLVARSVHHLGSTTSELPGLVYHVRGTTRRRMISATAGKARRAGLRDPDQNGVELSWDKPEGEWLRTPDGQLTMFTRRLD